MPAATAEPPQLRDALQLPVTGKVVCDELIADVAADHRSAWQLSASDAPHRHPRIADATWHRPMRMHAELQQHLN